MKITNPRYVRQQGYPLLELEIDGITTRIEPPRKPSIHAAGLVFIGGEFHDLVPPIEFKGTTLKGFTNNPDIFRLTDQLGRAANDGTFQVGAIEYPFPS